MELFPTPEQCQAVEELEYTKTDWTDEAKTGDDIETHLAKRRGPAQE